MSDHDTPPFARALAAAGVLGRVLLVQPGYKEHLDIPRGYLEPGETPYAACVREVREELAIEPPIGRLALRVNAAVAAREQGETVYLEYGEAVAAE
ncbi:NUDIX domain-containing protein [Nonomuraea endophytica]|uniref:NUDIX domain-containing protein n=1 Tax=Nonomuraea endophytica TaxID=714136 RepID=UPI0037CABCDB